MVKLGFSTLIQPQQEWPDDVDVPNSLKRVLSATDPETFLSRLDQEIGKWIRLLLATPYTPVHKPGVGQDWTIIGQQGCGDLTMNEWNIAYICSPATENKPRLLYLHEEFLLRTRKRRYSCLIKWKEDATFRGSQRVTIEDVRIGQFHVFGLAENNPSVVLIDDQPVANQIEFLVFGRRIIRNGRLVKFEEIIEQFNDIRHIFVLPNINPRDGRPRYLFSQEQHDDVWFGEDQLLANMNLRRGALHTYVSLDRTLCGASKQHIIESMRPLEQAGTYQKSSTYPTQPGQWRFQPGDDKFVEIFLRENIYPHSIIGLDGEGDLISYAWTGNYSKPPGWTIKDSAQLLINQNTIEPPVQDALLIDEGGDVFQKVWDEDEKKLIKKVPLKGGRRQIRAAFFFARKTSST